MAAWDHHHHHHQLSSWKWLFYCAAMLPKVTEQAIHKLSVSSLTVTIKMNSHLHTHKGISMSKIWDFWYRPTSRTDLSTSQEKTGNGKKSLEVWRRQEGNSCPGNLNPSQSSIIGWVFPFSFFLLNLIYCKCDVTQPKWSGLLQCSNNEDIFPHQ